MRLSVFKPKIHRATVTEANLNYEGSVTIDADLMEGPTSRTSRCRFST